MSIVHKGLERIMRLLKYSRNLLLKPGRRSNLTENFVNHYRSYVFIAPIRYSEFFYKDCLLDLKLNFLYNVRLFYSTGCQREVTSNSQIDSLLRKEQHTVLLEDSFIRRCDVSELASNRPSEDRWFATKSVSLEDSFVFGVLDGHGGEMCAHNVSQRLSNYIAAFLPFKERLPSPSKCSSSHELIARQSKSAVHDFLSDRLCQQSFQKLEKYKQRKERLKNREIHAIDEVSEALEMAFLQMDNDLHSEALRSLEDYSVDDIVPYLTAIQSGCCALVCYVTGQDLFIANTGDCRAVAGVKKEDGPVLAQPLSLDQTTDNPHEVTRILSEHPELEADSIFSNGRLLGILAPLRAFGDAWLKWDVDTIKSCFKVLYGSDVGRLIPLFYDSPPYLTARPAVSHHHLPLSGFQFLILATDGLWDLLSDEMAVEVVENYLTARDRDGTLDFDATTKSEVSSDNAATSLVRHALGGENRTALASMLSLPFPQVRMFRDDITVIVIVFRK